jgi:hypothetical protein
VEPNTQSILEIKNIYEMEITNHWERTCFLKEKKPDLNFVFSLHFGLCASFLWSWVYFFIINLWKILKLSVSERLLILNTNNVIDDSNKYMINSWITYEYFINWSHFWNRWTSMLVSFVCLSHASCKYRSANSATSLCNISIEHWVWYQN